MITVSQEPKNYTPVYNDVIYVVTSDKKTEQNFKYIADIYINGVGTAIERLKCIPDPVYGSGVFNLGRVIESYVTFDIDKTTYGFQQNLNSYVRYVVRFGEEYGLSSSGTTVYPNQVVTSTSYAWNAELDHLNFQDYTNNDYLITSTVVAGFLTNAPDNLSIRDNEDAWLYGMTDSSGTIKDARIRTYNSAGAIIQTVVVSNPYQAVVSTNDRFVRFGCGTSNLNSIASSGVISGSLPIIDTSVAKYDIVFRRSTGVNATPTRTYFIQNPCTRNEVFRFHFLNELGGFDSFDFIRGSTKKVEIKRSNYKKVTGALTSASTYSYSKKDRGTVQYNTALKDNIKVKSDWIKEETYTWLEELITSPEVYLDHSEHGLIPVNIQNIGYDFKQDAQDQLFNLEIEFEYSFDRYRQRG